MTEHKIENEIVRVILQEIGTHTFEQIELKEHNRAIPLITNLKNQSTLIFSRKNKMYSKILMFKMKTKDQLVYQSNDPDISILLKITLKEPDLIHFEYNISSNKTLKFSKLGINYRIALGPNPTFKWIPHVRPKENYIIADHVFRSPAITYNKDQYSFAFIPDIDLLSRNRPFQSFMDFNLMVNPPQFFYGFGNYKASSHIFFKHNPRKQMKVKKGTEVSFGYFIKIFNGVSYAEVLKKVNTFLWNSFGRALLYDNWEPQVLPYDLNTEEAFKAIFERHKLWVNFEINGTTCGGVFQNTWMGKRKRKIKFVSPDKIAKHKTKNISQIAGQESLLGKIVMHFSNSPFWIKRFDWLTRHIPIVQRTAEIWFNAWFLNLRTAYSFRYFGELWKNIELKEKGIQILNTVMNLPRIRGAFPTVVFPASWDATEISTINGLKAFIYTDFFNLVDISLTMYWALKFYQDFEKRDDILEHSATLIALFKEIQLENGAIPVYIDFEEDKKTPIISDILIDSASTAAPLMFIMEYYKITRDKDIIPLAEKIVKYLQTEIIPQNKWHDFEPFFSCTHLPFDIFDEYTQSHVMNTLCIFWAAEGLKELYKATQNENYLKAGEQVLAVLSLFQQVWNMPYISYHTFGGFGVQNADAELSDARQGLFVRVYMEYYLITGKKEYMERAIATLRACWAMQLLREYKELCPGNLKGIDTLDGVDRGCVCENYGHSGHDLRIPGYIMFDWGCGTSASATAYVKKHFGDLFIDFQTQTAWGIDGIIVHAFKVTPKQINLTIDLIPNKNYILVKARAVPQDQLELIINEKSLGIKKKEQLESGLRIEY